MGSGTASYTFFDVLIVRSSKLYQRHRLVTSPVGAFGVFSCREIGSSAIQRDRCFIGR